MIDHEKKIPGRKELLTAGILAAAVLIAAGTASLRGGAGAESAGKRGAAIGGPETAEARTASLEGTENVKNAAAYSRICKDGAYAAKVLMPAGDKTFTQKELILINPWHLLPENYERKKRSKRQREMSLYRDRASTRRGLRRISSMWDGSLWMKTRN